MTVRRIEITGEMAGAAGCLVLAAVCAVNALAQFDGFASLGRVGVAVAVVAGLAVVARARTFAATVGGRKMAVRTGPGHGTRVAARHEGGHVAVTRAVGGRVTGARIYPDGSGVTWLRLPRGASVVDQVAVDVAGEVAANTSFGCGSDQAYMRAALAQLPPGERAAAKRAGYARARGVVDGWFSDGGVSRTAAKLLRDGRA